MRGNNFRATKFSRRQVLKSGATVTLASAVTSLLLKLGCKSSTKQTTEIKTVTNSFTSGYPVTSSAGPVPPTSVSITSAIAAPPATNTASNAYTPPSTLPALIEVKGTNCTVAADRLYSVDHTWVKSLTENTVVLGITHTMVKILDNPFKCQLSDVGTVLSSGDSFGDIEGWKMTADIITPVSGTIIDRNILAVGFVGEDGVISALQDHYRKAWLVIIKLSKAPELNTLLTAQQYAELVAGIESVPDQKITKT